MKLIWFLLFLMGFSLQSFAHHGKGGSISYQYLGAGSIPNTSKYKITVQHYVNCERASDEPNSIYLGIFEASSNSLVKTITIARSGTQVVQKQTFDPCITSPPTICFYLDTYVTTTELPDNTGGYVLAEQDCCRADEIVNVSNPSSVGFTNVNSIPGVINGTVYRNNSSPTLVIKDTAVICHSSYFTIDFGATDVDGDSLSYTFCDATASGSTTRQPDPPSSPPYSSVPYTSGYSGSSPLGSGATIDTKTGLISGTAPATTGPYIIAVCIAEFRNGVQIGNTKKEVLVTVANCSLAGASLKVSYINCDNYTFSFANESGSSNISSYYWDFGVTNSATDTSTQAAPTYTYADTGTYVLKLKVTSVAGCSNSANSMVKVYPGFQPGFTVSGSCYQSPFQFTDATTVTYGSITNWSWNFGDASTTTDTSSLQNPSYQYASSGTAAAVLNVTSSKGCTGSYTDTVTINNKPAIYLPFTDTLICSKDSLPLIAQSSTESSYSWSPTYNIINPNTANPVVFPKDTTVYTVTVKDKECIDSATVTVNVLDYITVKITSDTAICKTDSITLSPVSEALNYIWKESTGLNSLSSYTVKYPKASPAVNTTYYVTANLGYCQDSTKIDVYVSPYPTVSAGSDVSICLGKSVQLNGTTTAPYFTWSPVSSLVNSNTLQPTATPAVTTNYLLTVRDTTYCTKSVTDTVVVRVIQPLNLNAGNDTSIVVGQPLQLHVTYDSLYSYTWSPSTGMNNSNIYNPIVTINSTSIDSITYVVSASSAAGCATSDYIVVTVFKTQPDIFVPTAFTPNADGKNDILKPILVGITKFNYFRVFNRWGQTVYYTNESGKGWDGTLNGIKQNTGTFVYMAEGTDYTGRKSSERGPRY